VPYLLLQVLHVLRSRDGAHFGVVIGNIPHRCNQCFYEGKELGHERVIDFIMHVDTVHCIEIRIEINLLNKRRCAIPYTKVYQHCNSALCSQRRRHRAQRQRVRDPRPMAIMNGAQISDGVLCRAVVLSTELTFQTAKASLPPNSRSTRTSLGATSCEIYPRTRARQSASNRKRQAANNEHN